MASTVPDTTDTSVAAMAIAWEIVRITLIGNAGSSNKPGTEIAQAVRDAYLTILGSAPKK